MKYIILLILLLSCKGIEQKNPIPYTPDAGDVKRFPNGVSIADSYADVIVSCKKDGGILSSSGIDGISSCSLGSAVLWTATLEDDSVIGASVYYEGSEITYIVNSLTAKMGTPHVEGEEYQWLQGNFLLSVSKYPKGIKASISFIGYKH